MKTCNVCGIEVEDRTSECPNCGSYYFTKQKRQENKDKFTRFKFSK